MLHRSILSQLLRQSAGYVNDRIGMLTCLARHFWLTVLLVVILKIRIFYFKRTRHQIFCILILCRLSQILLNFLPFLIFNLPSLINRSKTIARTGRGAFSERLFWSLIWSVLFTTRRKNSIPMWKLSVRVQIEEKRECSSVNIGKMRGKKVLFCFLGASEKSSRKAWKNFSEWSKILITYRFFEADFFGRFSGGPILSDRAALSEPYALLFSECQINRNSFEERFSGCEWAALVSNVGHSVCPAFTQTPTHP